MTAFFVRRSSFAVHNSKDSTFNNRLSKFNCSLLVVRRSSLPVFIAPKVQRSAIDVPGFIVHLSTLNDQINFMLKYLILILIAVFPFSLFSQQISPYIYLDHWSYPIINYLHNSASIVQNYYLTQPYLSSDLYYELQTNTISNRHWISLLQKEYSYFFNQASSKQERSRILSAVNYTQKIISENNDRYGVYRVSIWNSFSLPYLTLVNRVATAQEFTRDPFYYGDTGEWIQGRVEDAYVHFNYKALHIFGGRMSRNWGPLTLTSLILSDNPYSYDHFGFNVKTKKIQFSFYTTRLNDMNGIDVQSDSPQYEIGKRYLSVQRLDWNICNRLQLGFSEVAIYGGPNRTFEAFYLNPLNFYYVAQRNQRSQISGLWALDWYSRPFSKINFSGQFLIDDIIVNNEPGLNDRANLPDRLGLQLNFNFVDKLLPGTNMDLKYVRIWNWTYQSYRTYENYTYHDKSLGFPFNSYEGLTFEYSYFNKPPFIFNGRLNFFKRGESNLTAPFKATKEKFPKGVVENNKSLCFSISYIPGINYHFKLDAAYQSSSNYENIEGINKKFWRFQLLFYYSLKKIMK